MWQEIRTKQPEAIDQRSKVVYMIDLNPHYPMQNNWGGGGGGPVGRKRRVMRTRLVGNPELWKFRYMDWLPASEYVHRISSSYPLSRDSY